MSSNNLTRALTPILQHDNVPLKVGATAGGVRSLYPMEGKRGGRTSYVKKLVCIPLCVTSSEGYVDCAMRGDYALGP